MSRSQNGQLGIGILHRERGERRTVEYHYPRTAHTSDDLSVKVGGIADQRIRVFTVWTDRRTEYGTLSQPIETVGRRELSTAMLLVKSAFACENVTHRRSPHPQ